MRPPRIGLRCLLIAVAMVGLLLGTWTTWQRRAYYQCRAAYWASREQEALRSSREYEADPSDLMGQRWAAVERDMAARYRRFRLRYEAAQTRPWTRVDPDPLEYRGRVYPGVGFLPDGLEGE